MLVAFCIAGILLEIMEVAIIMASSKEDLLALDISMEMIQHFWEVRSCITSI